jgi:hypothetical protein
MKQARKVQILLPSVVLGAVLSMSGTASAGQAEYVQAKIPGANADGLAPGDSDPAPGSDATSKPNSRLNPNNDIDIDIDINTDTDGGNGDDANTGTETGS